MSEPTTKKKRASTVTRRYGGVDATERRRERQLKLVAAGLAMFGERGFHHTTVRDICGKAGLTERYFYESFKTLAELFDAVYADLRTQVQQRVMEAVITRGLSNPDPIALGEGALRAWFSFLLEDPRRARVMIVDAVSVDEEGMRGAENAIQEFKALLRTFVGMLYPDAQQHGIDVDVVISGMAGATIYIAKNWAQTGFKLSLDEVLMHNMLFYRSLDAIYKQMQDERAKALAAAPTAAPRVKRGRRATDV